MLKGFRDFMMRGDVQLRPVPHHRRDFPDRRVRRLLAGALGRTVHTEAG
jgi:hypothetical protein